MKRSHPFRFIRRNVNGKRIYYVAYDTDPSKPRSTGLEATEENYEAAVGWAYAHEHEILRQRITFRDATETMFTESCQWRRRVLAKGRVYSDSYFQLHRGRLVNHIWPRFGAFPPDEIKPVMIDRWLLDLKKEPATKDKLIQTFRKAYDELVYQGLASENPARHVQYYADTSQKRQPITLEEFHKLFPEDEEEMVRIWGTLEWAAFFYIMATTGMRPGEVAAIDLNYWKPGIGYACHQTVERSTRRLKPLKTAHKGVAVKPVLFNSRAESLIRKLLSKNPFKNPSQPRLLFRGEAGMPYRVESTNKHFRASCERASLDLLGRTQYCLRHFYATVVATYLTEQEAAMYLGQRTYRGEYDHRKVIDHLREDRRMRELSNEVFQAPEP